MLQNSMKLNGNFFLFSSTLVCSFFFLFFFVTISWIYIIQDIFPITELRQSRQSLAAASDRMSRASYAPSALHGPTHSVASSSRRTRPRSRSRDQLNGAHIHSHHRPGSR